MQDDDVPDSLVEAPASGTWSEPPADSVFSLRDGLAHGVGSTDAKYVFSGDEYRGLHLLGHIKGRMESKPPTTWREEVLLARQFRDQYADEFKTQEGDDLQPERIVNPLVKNSEKAAEILHRNGLDGRDINRNLTGFATPNIAQIPLSAAAKHAQLIFDTITDIHNLTSTSDDFG